MKEKECIFCKIIKGEIEDYKIWENEDFVLLLDKYPTKRGHCLLIPKKHVESIYGLENDLFKDMLLLIKKIEPLLREYTSSKKIGLFVKGFHVEHAHLHLIPLNYPDEDLTNKESISLSELEQSRVDFQNQLKKLSF